MDDVKTIKPQKLGVLTRTFENGDACYFAFSVLVFFPFAPPSTPLAEVDMWKLAARELGDEPLDFGMPKQRGEVLVTGSAYPFGGPRTVCAPRVAIGKVDKTLYVVGERFWKGSAPSEPVPFTEMPITWERAFGGEGYAQNPVGKGARARLDAARRDPLPAQRRGPEAPAPQARGQAATASGVRPVRLHLAAALLQGRHVRRRVAEGALPRLRQGPRLEHLERRARGPADRGLLPGRRAVHGRVHAPDASRSSRGGCPASGRAPSSRRRRTRASLSARSQTRLDTVRLFPHVERGILVFQGMVEVAEDDGADILHLVLGCEHMGEAKPVEHYREVLARRLDQERGYLFALRDRDLMPARGGLPDAPAEDVAEMEALVSTDGLLHKNMRRRVEIEHDKAKQRMVALGVDPGLMPPLPPEQPPLSDLDDLPAVVERMTAEADKAKAEGERKRAEAEQQARAHGRDPGHRLRQDDAGRQGEGRRAAQAVNAAGSHEGEGASRPGEGQRGRDPRGGSAHLGPRRGGGASARRSSGFARRTRSSPTAFPRPPGSEATRPRACGAR